MSGLFGHSHPDEALLASFEVVIADEGHQQKQHHHPTLDKRHHPQLLHHGGIAIVEIGDDRLRLPKVYGDGFSLGVHLPVDLG